MRIALVTTYGPPHLGGIERINQNFYDGFRTAGHEVRWIASRIPVTLPLREHDRIRVPTWNAFERRFGVPVPIWGPSALGELRGAVAWADAVQIVEALYVTSAMGLWAARRAGKPVVLCQNVGFIPYDSRVLNWVEHAAYASIGRWVLLGASHVVLATPTADEFVRRLLGSRLKSASTFPIGIDTSVFRPPSGEERRRARAALGLDSAHVVLFGSRLVEKKGVPTVLEVAARMPDVTFVVAGDGPMRALMSTAPANTRWLGAVDFARMVDLYRAADAVILPSRGEGLPVFIQEAMACGLPAVISSDEVYARELLESGTCYGAPREHAAMARAVGRALGATEEARAGARRYALERWGLDRMIERYIEIMQGLLAARPRGGRSA